jgi:NADH-quinone oxidoreductase subunit J
MGLETITFIIVGAIAVAAAAGMLLSSNAIHSALFLILNMACIAFFYLMLNAPFMAMVQITVYAGAIMVLFLFVIMLLGAERLRQPETRIPWQVPTALALAAVFLLTTGVAVLSGEIPEDPVSVSDAGTAAFGSPQQIGEELFTDYVLPFEMVAILLLAAIVGAVVLAHGVEFTGRRARLRRMVRRQQALEAKAPAEAAQVAPVVEPALEDEPGLEREAAGD